LPQLAASGHDGSEGLTRRMVRVALAFVAFAKADRKAKPQERRGNVATECSRCLLFIRRSILMTCPTPARIDRWPLCPLSGFAG
jgi:hypothetical protein